MKGTNGAIHEELAAVCLAVAYDDMVTRAVPESMVDLPGHWSAGCAGTDRKVRAFCVCKNRRYVESSRFDSFRFAADSPR